MTPDPDHLDRYESIFLGKITGFRAIGLEVELLPSSSKCDSSPGGDDTLECVSPGAGAQTVMIFSVPTRVFKGSVSGVQTLQIAGCSYLRGNIGDSALFFVPPESDSAIMVWQADSEDYAEWLVRLQRTEAHH